MMTSTYGKGQQIILSFSCDEELPISIDDPVTIEREFAIVSGVVVNSWPLMDGWYHYIIEVL